MALLLSKPANNQSSRSTSTDKATRDFARNSWSFPVLASDPATFREELKDTIVPSDPIDILSWMRVIPRRPLIEQTHPYVVIQAHQEATAAATVREVVIRVQGFIGSLNLNPLGNWDR